MPPPARRPDTRTFYLDHEAVVLTGGRLFYLNASAAFVWACREEGLSPAATAAALAEAFGISRSQARTDTDRLLDRWRAERLVLDRGDACRTLAPEPLIRASAPPDFRPAAERRYRLLDSGFIVRLESTELEDWVHPLLAHLQTPVEPAHIVNVFTEQGAILVTVDDRLVGRCRAADEVAALVNVTILLAAYPEAGGLAAFHAGAVGIGRGCVLLPAESGSGKSTLTAALVAHGGEHLSDELALLLPKSHEIRPVPVCFAIKEGSWPVLQSRFPVLATLPVHRRLDGRLVRYLPPVSRDGAAPSALPVVRIVFPRYRAGFSTRIESVSTAQALCRIADAGYDDIDLFDSDVVSELIDWLASVPCHSLEYSDIDEAIDAVCALARD